jgi:CubicO group peptidase (beta-lactamase class C family)
VVTPPADGKRSAALPHGVQGAADPNFALAVRTFAKLFPGRRFGGGALAVYLDGEPVVDVWTGWSDRRGDRRWSADTGAMVFSATKGMTSTVIHRLVDRGLLEYDMPVAKYWPEFAANGKADITVRDIMGHRAGLAHLHGVSKTDLLDHRRMEARVAAAPAGRGLGKQAYHAITYGWLMSGLARAVTGKGMRELFRSELAEPLNTDGFHLGRPPADAPTRVAQIIGPQGNLSNPILNFVVPKIAALEVSGGLGAVYFPGMTGLVQGDMPMLDSEIPSLNGVVTARALAKMFGAIANGGRVEGTQLLSAELVGGLAGERRWVPDRNILVPLTFHLGYHAAPVPGILLGFGHVGLGGTVGWADPETGMSFGLVHNRLLSPLDYLWFAGLDALLRRCVGKAREHGARTVPEFGAPFWLTDR